MTAPATVPAAQVCAQYARATATTVTQNVLSNKRERVSGENGSSPPWEQGSGSLTLNTETKMDKKITCPKEET